MLQDLLSKHKNKFFALSVSAIALMITGIIIPLNNTNVQESYDNNPSVITASEGSSDSVEESDEEHEEGDFYISPDIDEMHWADMQVFTSYEETSSGPVAVASEWNVSVNYRTELQDCDGETSTCTVFTDVGDQEFTLSADRDEDSDELVIDYSFDLENPFTDELPDWADTQIISFSNREIIQGYDDGSFGPGDDVTRGQFVLLITRMAEFQGYDLSFATDGEDCDVYDDLSSDHYAYDAVCTAHYLNWMEGIDLDDDFGVDTVLDRGMAAQLIFNAVGEFIAITHTGSSDLDGFVESIDDYGLYSLEDMPSSHSYYNASLILNYLSIMRGDGTDFNPDGDVNRAQAAVILWRSKYMMEWVTYH